MPTVQALLLSKIESETCFYCFPQNTLANSCSALNVVEETVFVCSVERLLEENMRGAHSCEETYKRPSAELTAAKWDSQSLLNGILKKTSILP